MTSNSETANLCGLNRKDFQTTINGKKTDLYILRNRKGYEVAISNYGGAICAIFNVTRDVQMSVNLLTLPAVYAVYGFWAIVAVAISFVGSFVLTWMFGFSDKMLNSKEQ